ncbi:glycosyltransferase family 1 protein [Cellulomonas sp. ACRRI]|uniref:rhamnosyltransferase WsaF family glycosyltransferase n=1 Tax=Cellulomonas sp. ACRRI TaxID=2918188 RepID=UPI001EF2EFC9|nr:glycosyltransferase family 1 protein [Cellulomonas sp. ACRRI]MCG7288262.1 glycosyltransferase family 1 protein [Cellulomonas sp. ACRRI]
MRARDLPAAARRVRAMGARETAQRAAARLYRATGAAALDFPLLPGDVADPGSAARAVAAAPPAGRPLTIGWLCVPPGPHSGGHTTMFRMVRALEAAGHRCVLYLYDRHGGDVRQRAAVVRAGWPDVRAEIRDVADGVHGVDACVATSWQTAHVLARRGTDPMRRLYFVQDVEPYFYPHGAQRALAEDSYRLGLRVLALGEMVAGHLRADLGVEVDVVPFGCDTEVYRPLPPTTRSGVVLYAKPDVARRGYDLARLALPAFHARHPDQEIHVYGDPARDLGVPATRHGGLDPEALNALYHRTLAGLALSFTNISLVAEEMLAAGTVPVVNDSADARADLPNPHVLWAAPTPAAVAGALSAAVGHPDPAGRAAAVQASVAGRTWAEAQARLVALVEGQVRGAPSAPSGAAPGGRAAGS